MLNNEQLAEIRERAERAPFELVPVGPENSSDLYALTGQEVEWINSAREDVPKLLDEVERLRKALEQVIEVRAERDKVLSVATLALGALEGK